MTQINNNSQQTREPHYRITFKRVVKDYRDGLLTARGALFYAVASSRKPGQSLRITPHQFRSVFGMSPSTFYSALAWNKMQHRLEIVQEGDIFLSVPIEETTGVPKFIFLGELSEISESDSRISESDSRISESDSRISESDSRISESDSRISESDSRISESESSKTAPAAQSRAPSVITDLNNLSLSTDHERERETSAEEEIDPEYREWLINKAAALPNPPTLTEQWILKQSKNPSNIKQFQKHQHTTQRANVPRQVAAEFKNPELERLRQLWAAGEHEQVYSALADNPQFTIGDVREGNP